MVKDLNLKEKIFIGLIVISGIALGNLLKFRCIFLWLTGIECLGCGMTRALVSALKFDFADALQYHPMFWSLPIIGIYILFDGKVFKNRAINLIVPILIGIGFVVNWLYKVI